MEYRPLGPTGWQVSALGFGASSLGGVFRDVDEAAAIRTVHVALDGGINLIDVSPFYGLTRAETVLGKALATVPRERYYLATKVGRYGHDEFDFSAERVVQSVDQSLQRLGVEVIDLIQCHDIEFGSLDQVVSETLPALEHLRAAGKVRAIGITGLPLAIFPAVLDRQRVDTVLSYCHGCLNDTALLDLLPDLTARGVGVLNASPLAMGLLSHRGAPGWHPAPAVVVAQCAAAAAWCAARGADLPRLAVQYSLSLPGIASTFVGTASPQHIADNLAWATTPPDPELVAGVLQILQPVHNLTWPSGRPENN
ncbi:MAG: aldo/keto reductase [Fimbriimonadaceae bacterium]|nr:aldo/keto reductase [Fimbriimonadaceae bacterium]